MTSKIHLAIFVLLLCIGYEARGNSGYTEIISYANSTFYDKYSTIPAEINHMLQCSSKYIWIATDNGLVRYDGYEFKTFRSDLKSPYVFKDNNITFLAEGQASTLWIGTRKGLYKMHTGLGIISQVGDAYLDNCSIRCIDVDRNGIIWVVTNEFLCRCLPDTFAVEMYEFPQSGRTPNDLLCDTKGRIWITFPYYGIIRFDPQSKSFIQYPKVTKDNNIMSLYEDKTGNYWFTSWEKGLFRMKNVSNPDSVEYENYRHEADNSNTIRHNTVYDIIQNPFSGKIWVLTKGGISILDSVGDPHSFQQLSIDDRSPFDISSKYKASFFDIEGNLWLSNKLRGLTKVAFIDKNIKEVYMDFLSEKQLIRSLHSFENGNIWATIDERGVLEKRAGSEFFRRLFTDRHSALRHLNKVSQITKINGGNTLFIGSFYRGGFIANLDSNDNPIDVKKLDNWPDSSVVNNIKVFDEKNKYVVTSDDKVYFIDKKNIDSVIFKYSISDISSYTKSRQYYWIGTSTNGLYRLSFEQGALKVSNYNISNGNLNSNNVLSLFTDNEDRIWIGTQGGGLSVYNNETDRCDLTNHIYKIHSSDIFNICQSDSGAIWFCSESEVFKLSAAEGEDICHVIYSTSNRVDDIEFVPNSFHQARNGILYYGGINGYVEINPNKASAETFNSKMTITDIKIDNKSIFFTGSKCYEISDEKGMVVYLNQHSNDIRIDFSSMWLRNPSMSRYAYKLEGADSEWHTNDSGQNFAIYNNLKKGKYKFSVKTLNDITEKDSIAHFTVVVKPSIFNTNIAYIIYILASLGILALVFILIIKNFRIKTVQHQILMEKKRSEELNEVKIEFFTNISHELLTPLSIITYGIDDICRKYQYENIVEIEIIKSNINRLKRLIRQVLELKKIESGNIRLKVSYGDVSSFIENICQNDFKPLIREKKIQFSFLSTKHDIFGFFDKDKLDKIIYNLLSNAFKYNHEFGHVNVIVDEVYQSGIRKLKVSVKDDGIGISIDRQKRIFDRYVDGDYRKFNTTGTGIGLSLTKDLTILHHGQIELISDTGKGCEFIVTLPLDLAEYSDQEIDNTYQDAAENDNISQLKQDNVQYDSMKKNILIVEDSEDLLYIMKNILSEYFNIYCAVNGEDALRKMHLNEIDLVVTDIMMPVMDGITMSQHIREDIVISHIPIIMLTAKSNEEDMLCSYRSGIDDYLIKPVNLDILKIKIEKLLEKRVEDSMNFRKAESTKFISSDEKFLSKAIGVIENNLNNYDYSFDMFYNEMNVSKSTLYRKMKLLTGMSPTDFIRNIRLKKACEIIKVKKVSVSEIAYEVGFNDSKYFSVCFKKEFGITPTEYINKYHLKED